MLITHHDEILLIQVVTRSNKRWNDLDIGGKLLMTFGNVERIRFGQWNLRTLYKIGKSCPLAKEVEGLKVDLVEISEVRWNGCGLAPTTLRLGVWKMHSEIFCVLVCDFRGHYYYALEFNKKTHFYYSVLCSH